MIPHHRDLFDGINIRETLYETKTAAVMRRRLQKLEVLEGINVSSSRLDTYSMSPLHKSVVD